MKGHGIKSISCWDKMIVHTVDAILHIFLHKIISIC